MSCANDPITPEQINDAIKHGFEVIVIINGEFYEYAAKERSENNGI